MRGWVWYAVPLLQVSGPLFMSAAILGVLVALWHLPLVLLSGATAVGAFSLEASFMTTPLVKAAGHTALVSVVVLPLLTRPAC